MNRYIKMGVAAFFCLQIVSGCSEKTAKKGDTTEATGASGSSSLFGKNTEEKVDDFLSDYVKDLRAAMDEADDQKAISKLKDMKAEFEPRAAELKAEVEEWEKSLSESDKEALEKKMENKPYIKELITLGFTAAGRFNKTPELQQAFEDLNSSMDFGDFNDEGDEIEDEGEVEEIPEEESSN
ncbi:hypothetical protein GXP67_15435 [Rhodocytophaga rosea]|uniref:Uncharacterized protein n=1 Tax=Rhodocytophaga rosea TaxID=2704465 RepID=A0A6C0GIP8_9BACT|nr:hypothetical protein [Rhodocytophaga rosea]QHT67931.1 hypothetical protein GXP67_15435 [Rhodocytophaga rosea]